MYIENGREGKLILKYGELIEPWVPSAFDILDYNRLPVHNKEQEYFLELQELLKLHSIFSSHENKQNAINIVGNLLEIMEEFVLGHLDIKMVLQHYSYVIKQQIEHVQFFASGCSALISDDLFQETVSVCKQIISERFAVMVKNMDLGEYSDMSYYDEAIKYLDMYRQYPECQQLSVN